MTHKDSFEDFQRELNGLLNKFGLDNKLNTPDYILGEYLVNCLNSYYNITCSLENHSGTNNERTTKEST